MELLEKSPIFSNLFQTFRFFVEHLFFPKGTSWTERKPERCRDAFGAGERDLGDAGGAKETKEVQVG